MKKSFITSGPEQTKQRKTQQKYSLGTVNAKPIGRGEQLKPGFNECSTIAFNPGTAQAMCT